MRYREKQSAKNPKDKEEEEKSGPTNISKTFNPKSWNPYFYEAYGLVYKVQFTNTGLRVYVDINVLSPLDQTP